MMTIDESVLADLRRKLAEAEAKVKSNATTIGQLVSIIDNADKNREALGDACRICGARARTIMGGKKVRDHNEGCPIASVLRRHGRD